MEWLKSQLANWKVRVALVGGALVVATSYGTCTLDPEAVSTNDTPPETTTSETVEVSATTTGTTDEDGVDDNTTGATPPSE